MILVYMVKDHHLENLLPFESYTPKVFIMDMCNAVLVYTCYSEDSLLVYYPMFAHRDIHMAVLLLAGSTYVIQLHGAVLAMHTPYMKHIG